MSSTSTIITQGIYSGTQNAEIDCSKIGSTIFGAVSKGQYVCYKHLLVGDKECPKCKDSEYVELYNGSA